MRDSHPLRSCFLATCSRLDATGGKSQLDVNGQYRSHPVVVIWRYGRVRNTELISQILFARFEAHEEFSKRIQSVIYSSKR